MKNTGGSGRSKSAKDKGSSKSAQTHIQNTAKSEGPPMKTMQPTAEQLALNNLIHSKDSTAEDADLKDKIKQIMDLTFCSQEKAEIALYDSKNDMDKAVNQVLEGGSDESEWRESGKKKKKQKPEPTPAPTENHNDTKPDRRDNRDRNERDNRDRNKEEKENGERNFREQSDNYRQRARRNDNRPPRLSRGRGRPDRAGDRPERGEEENEKDDNRDRGFDRGRGRGRGFGPRRGRGGGSGGGSGGTFRPNRGFENKNSQFDNGPQIDTWTNETAVIGEKEPKISNWGDSKEDWNEDIDSWTGSLAETKVFTASGSSAPEPTNQVPIESNALSNTFDLGGLYPKHLQNDMSAEASYISQFNQQATESIKNSIGIGSGQSSSLQNSMTSQTASNVSALVSLQQNALHDNLGPSLTELTGNNLTGSGLAGNSLVGTSLGNSLSTSLPVNSLTGSALHSSSLSGNDLTGNSLTSLSGTSLAGNSLTGTSVTGSGLSSMTGSSLSAGSQSVAGPSNVIPASSVSQNAMLQQRQKPQRSKLPPPSKIPASAVEMPGNMMTTLDVQFGNLEFGSDSSAFSFGGNESVNSAFTSADSNSTSTVNDHGGATVGQVQNLSKTSESLISGGLEQSSPRSSSLYQQSPYTTPTKQNPADTANSINSPPESLQMQGSSSDLKSNQLMAGQAQPASLPSTKIDSNLGSYSSGSSYQSTGYQSQKSSAGYQSSTKPAGYSGTQYQSAPSQNQSNSSQFSSQYSRQSNQNQFQSNNSQFPSGSQYQSPPSGYQPSQSGYQSAQSGYQSNQQQYQSGQSQFQNFQSGSTFQNQSNYSSNQSNPSVLYPTTTSTSYSSQSPQNSLYSQSSRPNSYSNQSYLNEHATGAGSSFQTSVTQSSSAFKETQSGASSFRDNVASSTKTRDSQSDSSTFNRDTQSASSFSDSQSMAYNRDSQSVGSSFNRDPSSSFTRDSKSASGSYPRDTPTTDTGAYSRDSQSASASYSGRDSQSSTTGFRDTQTGASGYGSQAGSYPRETSQSQTQAGYSAKNYRNSTEVTSLQSSFTGSKLADNFSKMGVKDGQLDTIQSSSSQFDSVSSASKATINATSLTSSTTSSAISSTGTTVISSTTTKISTLPSATAASSKAPPNLPPGVPLMAQQYIMGQAGTLPFYVDTDVSFENLEDEEIETGKDWDKIIPQNDIDRVEEEERQKALLELNLPPRQRTTIQQLEKSLGSEDEEKNVCHKKRGRPRAILNDNIRAFTNKEIRQFIKSYKKYGDPLSRLIDIAGDAGLKQSNSEILKLAEEVKSSCEQAVKDFNAKKQEQENPEGTGNKKGPRGISSKIASVAVNVQSILKANAELEPLVRYIPKTKTERKKFRVDFHTKMVHWDCSWGKADDSNLLKGIYEYGMGNWEQIKMDQELGLYDKILPDGDKKPQVKQLQTRADYLLRKIKKHLDGGEGNKQ